MIAVRWANVHSSNPVVGQRGDMHAEFAARNIVDVPAQRVFHYGKCEFVPGNLDSVEQLDVKAFQSCAELFREQTSHKGHIYLTDMWKAQDRMQPRDGHLRLSFF